jgi:hypothetical protein
MDVGLAGRYHVGFVAEAQRLLEHELALQEFVFPLGEVQFASVKLA